MIRPNQTTTTGKNRTRTGPTVVRRGRFVAGNRANLGGRPKGRQNKATELIAELLAGEAETLTRALIRRAKAGNATAMGLIFARLAPAPKDRTIQIALPRLATLADIATAQDIILDQPRQRHHHPERGPGPELACRCQARVAGKPGRGGTHCRLGEEARQPHDRRKAHK